MMRSALLIVLSFAALGGVAHAQDCVADPKAPRDSDAIKTVIHAWTKAYIARDRGWFEQNFGNEIAINGQLRSRDEEIRSLQREDPVESVDIDDAALKIQMYGNFAIATGTERIVARGAQGPRTAAGRFTNVFVQCSGRWLVIADDWFSVK